MAQYYIAPKSSFDATADAIREKTGSQATIEWTEDGFADAIDAIPSGGGGAVWTRPSDWPNLDALDISGGNIVYMTYLANEQNGFCNLLCKTSSGQYTVEVGSISGSTFTADTTYNINSNTACIHYFGSALGGYKVLRVTGNLTYLTVYRTSVENCDGVYRYGLAQGLLEVRGKAQNITYISFRSMAHLQHIYLYGSPLAGTEGLGMRDSAVVFAELPYCVTSSLTSLNGSFYACDRLKKIDTTGWVTSGLTNLNTTFYNCLNLEILDVSNWDVSKVTTMQDCFNGCSSLKTLNVSQWDTGKVEKITAMFRYCEQLEELDVSDWDLSSVNTSAESMFDGCVLLQKLDVGDWDTSGFTSFKYFLYNCKNIKEVDVSSWDVGSCTTVERMFHNCHTLQDIDISQWDMAAVTNTTNMFSTCNNLTGSLTIPASLTRIDASTFNATRQIFEFHFMSTTPPTLANTNAFGNMTDAGGKKIYVPYSADHSVLNAYQTATNWSTYASYIYEEAAP